MTAWATKALNGETKYWVRIRITTNITSVATLEQMKLHTDRREINADGYPEYFGASRPERTIDIPVNSFQAAGGSPANQDVAYGTNLIVGHVENNFQNAVTDQSGIAIRLPVDTDTSYELELDIEWMPSTTNTGNCTWTIYHLTHGTGTVLAVGTPGPLTETTTAVNTAGPGVQYETVISTISLDISGASATDKTTFALMIQRQGGADAFTGNAIVDTISLRRRAWSDGGYVA